MQNPIKIAIHWFRLDLRLIDNPSLWWAVEQNYQIIPVFIFDEENIRTLGGASRWWLHHSLIALSESLKSKGLKLILRRGNPEDILHTLMLESRAEIVLWNRVYDKESITRDAHIKETLNVKSFNGSLLAEPWTIKTGSGGPFKVYTPFWNALNKEAHLIRQPLDTPNFRPFTMNLASDHLDDWNLLPTAPNWATEFGEWVPGEKSAHKKLDEFIQTTIHQYTPHRDIPATDSTSRLSPHLHWGEISPQSIWHHIHQNCSPLQDSELTYIKELVWREFSYQLLYHFPELPQKSLQKNFENFPWSENTDHLHAWQRGQTGVPIVDAGMRQLWHTGWMHNRVRMIVASYLIKNLLLPWQWGEEWFWDTLVDADLASNGASWQWVAGSSPHSAPFYRIFNPITQSQKFDPQGAYIKKWVPELSTLSAPDLYDPSSAPASVLRQAGIELGVTYPHALVDLKESRTKAMEALEYSKS